MASGQAFEAIVHTLRGLVKKHGHSYAQIAESLGISERTIKRDLSGREDPPFGRLLQICKIVGVEFADVVELAGKPPIQAAVLTDEQEAFLVAHPHHMAFYSQLKQGTSPAAISERFGLRQTSTARYMRDLDEAGLVQRLPGDRVRILHPGPVMSKADSPLYKHDMTTAWDRLAEAERRAEERGDPAALVSSSTRMKRSTLERCRTEMAELINRFHRCAQLDRTESDNANLVSVEWMMGIALDDNAGREKVTPVDFTDDGLTACQSPTTLR